MSTKKRVFKKLTEETKVELSAQKVELGLIDDVNKISTNLESDWKKVLSIAVDGAKSLEDKIMAKTKPLNASIIELRSNIDKAEKALKDLGIGKNSDILKAKKSLKTAQGQVNELGAISRRLRSIY